MGETLLHGPPGEKDHSRSSTMTSIRADGSLSSASVNLPSTAAVMSMLKTTTEMGDLGQVTGPSRFQKPLRAGRSSTGQPPSRTSSHYSQRTASMKSGVSNRSFRNQGHGTSQGYHHPRERIHGSYGLLSQRGFTKSQEFPRNADARLIGMSDNARSLTLTGAPVDRSFSFTPSGLEHSRALVGKRSIQNLKSNTQFPRPHSPYNNPPRYPHPGYRGVSPALSDTAASSARPSPLRPDLGPRSFSSVTSQRQAVKHPHPLHQNEVQTGNHRAVPHRFAASSRLPQAATHFRNFDYAAHAAVPRPNTRTLPIVPPQANPVLAPAPLKPRQVTLDGHAEGSEEKPDGGTLRDSAPHVGFVQRVKTALESRAPPEQSKAVSELPQKVQPLNKSGEQALSDQKNERPDKDEPNKLTRDMIKAAVEPSCEITIQPGPEKAEVKRLTREFVKAAVGESEDLKHKESQDTFDVIVFGSETVKSSFDERSLLAGPSGLPKSSSSSGEKDEGHVDEATVPSLDASATEYSHLTTASSPHRSIPKPVEEFEPEFDVELEDNSSEEEHHKLSDTDARPNLASPFRPKSLPLQNGHLKPLANYLSQQQTRQSCPSTAELRFTDSAIDEELVKAKPSHGHVHHLSQLSILDGFLPDAAEVNDTDIPKPLKSAKIVIEPPIDISSEGTSAPERNSYKFDSCREGSEKDRLSISSSSEFRRMSTYLASEPRQFSTRSGNAPLPDLSEDSQESASTTNLRMLGGRPPIFRALGNRSRGESKQPTRVFIPPKVAQSYLRRSLAAVGKIPSFKFSRTDLTTKLNLALGIRASRSLEDVSPSPSTRTSAWLEERAVSADMFRYRYASFFIRAQSKEDVSEIPPAPPPTLSKRSSQDGIPGRGKALLQEINRLSIPSVDILNVRLSEFLPTFESTDDGADAGNNAERRLKESPRNSVEDEIGPTKVDSEGVLSNSSSRLGTGIAEKSKLSRFRLHQELPPLTNDANELASYRLRLKTPTDSRGTSIEGSQRHEKLLGDAPFGFIDTSRYSNALKVNPKLFASTQTRTNGVLKSHSPRAGTSSTSLDINIGRNKILVPRTGKGKIIRKTRSNVETPDDEAIRIAGTMSPMLRFDANLVPAVEGFNTLEDGTATMKDRLLGSIGRKMGFKARTADRLGFQINPGFLHGTDRFSTVDPGDRYPTSSLTSPDGFVMDENRSFFSDDSSQLSLERETRASLRKRLTRLKPKRSPAHPQAGADGFRSNRNFPKPLSTAANASTIRGPATTFTPYNTQFELESSDNLPPAGMGKFEFHFRRAFETLRGWTLRFGELFPFHIGKKKQPPPWYDHHEDSLMYSGV